MVEQGSIDLGGVSWPRLKSLTLVRLVSFYATQLGDVVRSASGPVGIRLRLCLHEQTHLWIGEDLNELSSCPPGWTYDVVVQDPESLLGRRLNDTLGLQNGQLPDGVTIRTLLPDEVL